MKTNYKKNSSIKKRYFKISCDVFTQDIIFCFNMTTSDILKVLKKYNALNDHNKAVFAEDSPPNVCGTLYFLEVGYLIALKWDDNRFRTSLSCAIHEITHLTHYILREARTPLQEETEEVYAYLMADLTLKFLNKVY